MLVECLTRRQGGTPIILKSTKYMFLPVPGATKRGTETTSYAEVNAEEDLRYFMAQPNFREYDAERTRREQQEYDGTRDKFVGFAIEKDATQQGYIIVDRRGKPIKFYGTDGQPHTAFRDAKSFPSEMDAYQWLTDEIEFLNLEEEAQGKESKG